MPDVDTAVLDGLARDLGDAEVVREVVATYLDELPARRAAASAAVARRDVAGLRAEAHSLRSASALVGALGVADACHRLEYGDPTPEVLDRVAAEFDGSCADAERGLRAWLTGRGPGQGSNR